jgi:hypothetical protein
VSGGTVVNQWGNSTSAFVANPQPGLLPLALALDSGTAQVGDPGTPTAGNWMFAVAAWRQDAGSVPTIEYNSTVNIRDDAHNFWSPVSVVAPQTGIVRTSVWMAPAFRVPQYVFASPTNFQNALTLTVFEVEADCPWYEVAAIASTSVNQGTAITLSQDPASGIFTVGAIAYDLSTVTPAYSHTGFTQQPSITTSNGSDHTGDLIMTPFTGTTTGSSMTLSATQSSTADWAEVLVAVHGVTDAIACPYEFELENWPALTCEMATGAILNQNWAFNSGISPWTAQNSSTISASSLFTFGDSAGSLLVTPDGSHSGSGATSEHVTAVPYATYAVSAWVNVPSGWSGGVSAGVFFYDATVTFISGASSGVVTVTGSAQQLTVTAVSPAATASAVLFVQLAGGSAPPATTLLYVGFASFALAGALGAVPDDQLNWTDFSGRMITQEAMRISRGIQYEQQSLEAGTLEMPLGNNDGYLTPGNQQSPYFPFIGQTDVPIRIRAIWPSSITPYSVLYSGFTDDVKQQWSEETIYGYSVVTAADCWSRLTTQMVTALQQEILQDIPAGSTGGFWPCNDMAGAKAAANWAPTPLPSLAQQASKYGTSTIGFGFGNTTITLTGDPGGTGWFLDSLTSAEGTKGASLVIFPPAPSALPPPSGGVTVSFWVFITDASASGITWAGAIASCVGAKGRVWELSVGAPSGGSTGQIGFTVWDKLTNTPTSTTLDAGDNWGSTHYYSVVFTQATWTVYRDGALLGAGTCDFANVYNGFCFNGLNVPWQGLDGNCFNGVIQDIAVFPGALPQVRVLSQYNTAFTAQQDEIDTSRIARVTGYGGFTPPLAMQDLFALWPDAGVDPVTQITDTQGQVVSSYITNIASSTLAGLFTDGTGALVYRRRAEWYDRPIGQWVLGEHASLPLNVNPQFGTSVTSWTAANAALAWAAAQGQFYGAGAAGLTANGGGAVTLTPENQAASPGVQYNCVIAVNAPAGYASGAQAKLTWLTSGLSVISTTSGNVVPLVAGSWTWLIITGTAPAATAFVRGSFATSGTPSNGTVFYVSSVLTTVWPGEAPYLRDVKLSDDRAQMFNRAVLTQSGTGEKTTFSGTSLVFTPSSGITVTAVNEASAAARGNVPYLATLYLQNTQQNLPSVASFTDNPGATPFAFVPAEGAMEDFAQWIINTLGTPVLRGESAVLTPAATRQAMITALQAEVGDTVTVNRRPVGAPALSLVTYLSQVEHEIDIREGWRTTYQLSPAPQVSILRTDDPSNGVLDSTSLLGW